MVIITGIENTSTIAVIVHSIIDNITVDKAIVITINIHTTTTICDCITINQAVGEIGVVIGKYTTATIHRIVITYFGMADIGITGIQTTTITVITVFETIVLNNTMNDFSLIRSIVTIRIHTGTIATVIIAAACNRVIHNPTVAYCTISPQINTYAVAGHSSVLDGETVPCGGSILRERLWLEEYALYILSIKDSGVFIKITQAQIIVSFFGTGKTAIHIHTGKHDKGIFRNTVTMVNTGGHPYHCIVHGSQIHRGLHRSYGIIPAGTIHSACPTLFHIYNAIIGRQGDTVVG